MSEMSGNQILPSQQAQTLGQFGHTYGCLDPIDIDPLSALLDDIRRTYAHIMWLEHYIAVMPEQSAFTTMEWDMQTEIERSRVGRPTVVGSVRWQIEQQRRREQQGKRSRPATHPAIKQLMDERRHLADITTKAIAVGIKLDQIDYSRKQADMIVSAMGRFALESGIDPTQPEVSKRITDALEFVLQQADAQ